MVTSHQCESFVCERINQTRSYRGRKERFRVISGVNLIFSPKCSNFGDENIFRHLTYHLHDEIYIRHLSAQNFGDENIFRHLTCHLHDEMYFRHLS